MTNLAVSVGSPIPNFLRIPSSADSVGTFLVVANSISFVLPLGAKAQSFRCSSSPHQTHFVGLWRGPCPKAALWNLAFIRGFGGETCLVFYEFALVQLTRFRPVASSQAPHPSFCLSGQKLSRSAAPPFPTKPTLLGFGGGPFLHCFHGLLLTAPTAANS